MIPLPNSKEKAKMAPPILLCLKLLKFMSNLHIMEVQQLLCRVKDELQYY